MRRQLIALLRSSKTRAVLSLALVFSLGLIFNADCAFLKWDTHRDMLRQISVNGILACGMTIVIIAGGIDLSVGSVLGVSAVMFSIMTMRAGFNPMIAIVLTLAAGFLWGSISGLLIARFKFQSFIATLAVMVLARGAAKFISHGQKVSSAVLQDDGSYRYVDVPHIYDLISARMVNDNIAVVSLVLFLCIVLCGILLSRMKWGRYFYAIGGNEEAARLAGIPVGMVTVLAYGLCGLFGAVAGICQAGQEMQGDPEAGIAYELSAIAIVVIGGTSLRGGSGSILLTFIGILIIGYLEKILSINAVGEETRLMLTGFIIITAVLFQRIGKS